MCVVFFCLWCDLINNPPLKKPCVDTTDPGLFMFTKSGIDSGRGGSSPSSSSPFPCFLSTSGLLRFKDSHFFRIKCKIGRCQNDNLRIDLFLWGKSLKLYEAKKSSCKCSINKLRVFFISATERLHNLNRKQELKSPIFRPA